MVRRQLTFSASNHINTSNQVKYSQWLFFSDSNRFLKEQFSQTVSFFRPKNCFLSFKYLLFFLTSWYLLVGFATEGDCNVSIDVSGNTYNSNCFSFSESVSCPFTSSLVVKQSLFFSFDVLNSFVGCVCIFYLFFFQVFLVGQSFLFVVSRKLLRSDYFSWISSRIVVLPGFFVLVARFGTRISGMALFSELSSCFVFLGSAFFSSTLFLARSFSPCAVISCVLFHTVHVQFGRYLISFRIFARYFVLVLDVIQQVPCFYIHHVFSVRMFFPMLFQCFTSLIVCQDEVSTAIEICLWRFNVGFKNGNKLQ